MLLLSVRAPIFGLYRRGLRRGCGLGIAGPLIDPNVAIKAWHMACVLIGSSRQRGEPFGARRQGGSCVPENTFRRCGSTSAATLFDVRVNGNQEGRHIRRLR